MKAKDYNHIKEWLEPLLAKRNMSVEQLSQTTGLTRTAIYWWISDKYRPDEGSMVKICKALGRPLEEGFRQYTPRKKGRPFGSKNVSPRGLPVR